VYSTEASILLNIMFLFSKWNELHTHINCRFSAMLNLTQEKEREREDIKMVLALREHFQKIQIILKTTVIQPTSI
jgi:hypothetical protein